MTHELERLGAIDGSSGELYGFLFENPGTGLKLGLYWNLFIQCEPIHYQGETWEPAILFDWLDTASWGQSRLTSASKPRVESSFYMAWHDQVTTWRLKLQHDERGYPTRVAYELLVDYSGYDGDPKTDLRIFGASPVALRDIGVTPENFSPKPSTSDEARELVVLFYPPIRQWPLARVTDRGSSSPTDPCTFRFSPPT